MPDKVVRKYKNGKPATTTVSDKSTRLIKIYYDNKLDELTFVNRKTITAPPVAVVAVPQETIRDGDCVVLPDADYAVFKNRRVSPLELYIKANHGCGSIRVVETTVHGMFTFSAAGK